MNKRKVKIVMIPTIIFCMVLFGILFINNSKRTNYNVTKSKTKVGLILNGSVRDLSWGQSHFEGLSKAAANLNLNIIYIQSVPESEICKKKIEQLIDLGCKIIICNSYNYGPYVKEMSELYPDIYFLHATGLDFSKNLTSYFGRIYQMRYLAGIVAGLQTETNKIGYVAAMKIPEVVRGINAFTLGVRSVNKKAEVFVEWTGSWTENEATINSTFRLLADNPEIDVITMHTDSQAVLQIAEEHKIWSIGYNLDNSIYYPDTFLTAPIWNWHILYEQKILECLQGKFTGNHYWFDLDSGIIDLAPLTPNVKQGIETAVTEQWDHLRTKTYDVFYGPIKDNEGVLRVEEGENLSDSFLLDYFDWFVEGVVINEER